MRADRGNNSSVTNIINEVYVVRSSSAVLVIINATLAYITLIATIVTSSWYSSVVRTKIAAFN